MRAGYNRHYQSMQAGVTLGPYEIVAPLGAGGMGEVYRARDRRLNRDVAIKVLPAAVTSDPTRLRRFETEARSAGQLSHPNILAVFDFGVAEGAPYLVTELLEGETLRARLTPAIALPPRKAIEIAQQVARGLAAAHAKGIIHRDLKPENIFLTRDGQAKILDFGLAKVAETVSDDAETVAAGQVTSAGQVLGTAGYMSPEQVRGQAADARSDLFALGAILYEMLTGRRAFQRDTAAETMTAVLKEEPAEITAAPDTLAPALQRVVDHCLEKDPAARFQSARDLEFALAALTGSSSTRTAALAALPAPRRQVPMLAAVALTAVVVGLAVFFAMRPAPSAHWHFTAVTNFPGVQAQPVFSPDGRSVAFTSNEDGHYNIYVALLSGGTPAEVTHGPNAKQHPAWSPDGATLAYARLNHSGLSDIWEVPALGGTPRRVVPDAAEPSFTRDGDLVYEHDGAVWEASSGGENPHQIVGIPPGDTEVVYPRLSPDGRYVAFSTANYTSGPYRDLAVANLASGKIRVLTTTGLATSPVWTPDSHTIYFAYNGSGAMNLWKIHVDGSGLQQITSGEGDDADLDISADGKRIIFDTMHVGIGLAEVNLQTPVNQQTPQMLHVDPARWLWGPQYSPDGKRLAYFAALKGVVSESIGVANADGSGAVPLVEDQREDIFPVWSQDGQSLYFVSMYPHAIRTVPVAGGSPRTLYRLPTTASYYLSVGRDGRILFQNGNTLDVLNPDGKVQAIGALPAGADLLAWSPDQRQVAYRLTARRANDPAAGLWVTDLHAPPRQIFQGSVNRAVSAAGSLYVLQAQADLGTVLWKLSWDGRGRTQVSTRIVPLWDANYNDVGVVNYVAVSPDGNQAVFQDEPGLSENIGLLTLASPKSRQ
ncbi:MAG: serine/threonine-protein kinase [Acidobacteria bacterium]|nr:MAG: serine/threonine-protein kinase [Acidobacteriota bacterium]